MGGWVEVWIRTTTILPSRWTLAKGELSRRRACMVFSEEYSWRKPTTALATITTRMTAPSIHSSTARDRPTAMPSTRLMTLNRWERKRRNGLVERRPCVLSRWVGGWSKCLCPTY